MNKEKTLGGVIFGPINLDNGELNKPVHMEPGPYEPDDRDFCPYCGKETGDGFCNEAHELGFFAEEDEDEAKYVLREEKRARD
jgi:hypothetical protein